VRRARAEGVLIDLLEPLSVAAIEVRMPTLAEGGSVASASDRAGYESPRPFVAAFRRETGMTPAEHFRV
jgi:AraC-like DNA-binding protein